MTADLKTLLLCCACSPGSILTPTTLGGALVLWYLPLSLSVSHTLKKLTEPARPRQQKEDDR